MSLAPRHRGRAAEQAVPAAAAAPEEPQKGETAIWRRGLGARAGPIRRLRPPAVLSVLGLVAVAVAFALVYGQLPLYTGDHHSALVHGLARAGVGRLELDWLAGTADPAPVTSLLVAAAASLDAQWLLLVGQAVLIGVYGLALLGLATTLLRIDGLAQRLVLLAALLFVHSWLAVEVRGGLPDNLRSLATEGLAGQQAPGLTFGPSLFGVLLVVSLFAYARGRPITAIALAGAATILDPAYLLGSIVLCIAYLADTFFNTGARTTLVRGTALATVLLSPVALYSLIAFAPAPPAVHEVVQTILADFALPQQAKPDAWFGPDDAVRLGIVAAGLALTWRSALFPVLALATAASAVLAALQLVTASETLALLFPWQLSVVLVPVSTAIVLAAATRVLFALGRGGERLASRFTDGPPARVVTAARTGVCVVAGMVIAVSMVIGGERIARLDAQPEPGPLGSLVAGEPRPGDLYLVPPRAYELRLDAGVPVYVDLRTHPYEDREVLKWRRRLDEAARVYAGDSLRCASLAALARRARITHVVVRSPTRARCDFLTKSGSAARWTVFALEAERGRSSDRRRPASRD